jgi:TonB family protein
MSKFKYLIVSSLALIGSNALAQATPALQPVSSNSSAPTQIDPLAMYKSYNEALDAGRVREAAGFATQAWQAAEAKWGASNPNTAGLAYNAAWSAALIGKSPDRLDAARRAVELAPRATASYSLDEAQFLLAYGEYFATDPKDRPIAAAKLAQAALPIEDKWSDFLIVNALTSSAFVGTPVAQGRTTVAIAERALAAIDRVSPNDKDNRTLALFARAQGRLIARVDQVEAVADLVQARVAYGPMRNPDDKAWGALAAWELAARSVVISNDAVSFTQTGSRISRPTSRPIDLTEAQSRIVDARSDFNEQEINCDGIKRTRRVGADIEYPPGAAKNLEVAGVVLRLDMDTSGRVIDARLLGAVPAGAFGESALRAVRSWKYDLPANVPSQCLIGRQVRVSFALR